MFIHKFSFVLYQVALDDLQTKVTQVLKQNQSSVTSRGHLQPDSDMLSEHVSNLSVEVKKLSDYVDQQSKNLAELVCLFQLPLIFFSKMLYILCIIYLSIYLFICLKYRERK